MSNPHAIPPKSEQILDMPKLQSPFTRVSKIINGREAYVVTPAIDPDYMWVFEDEGVRAVEKLDGTNVSIVIEGGRVRRIFNRTTELDFFGGHPAVTALIHAAERGYLPKTDGQFFGEAMGGKIQSNPLNLKEPLWFPFHRAFDKLSYKSWGKYPKTFEAISEWFKNDLISLAAQMYSADHVHNIFAEGVIFTHPDGRMAKLRRDMFDWYDGKGHKE